MGIRALAGLVAALSLCAAGDAAAQIVVFERGGEMLFQDVLSHDAYLEGGAQPASDWVHALDDAEPFVVDPLAGPFIGWSGLPMTQQPVIHYSVGANAGVLPEPAAWGMMLVGFFGAGFLLRRYKAQMMAAWPAEPA
jgi:hypothetical protein